ncbi:MAG TPA: alpha/beta hydrolase [Clostridiaceae bacterium]|jgi:predicted alpha/beta hydrolase family esterase|nr:alpha/beta hydrolase [Clostridiaceae bacterium]
MKNVFIIHSYNGDTEYSFAPSVEKLCKENNIDYYFPKFPIRSEATYEGWENILNSYKEKGIFNNESIVISHSLGTQFIPKYLAKNNTKISKYISVAGFVNYKGREDLENILKRFQPTDNEFKKCQTLVDNIYSIYSDNDEMNSVDKLEGYAEKLSANKMFIKGAGHFNLKAGITEIEEINKIILGEI